MTNIRPIEPDEMICLIQHQRFSSLDNQGDGWKVWFFDDPDEDEASSVDYVYGDTLDDVMLEWAEVVRQFEAGERG